MKVITAFFTLMLLPFVLYAQLKGVVYDAESKEPLPYVLVTANGSVKTLTDIQGLFSITPEAQAPSIQLYISHSFYRDTSFLAAPGKLLHIYLKPEASELHEVEIVAATEQELPQTELSAFSRKDLNEIGTPLGEPDLLRALQNSPGVLQTGETKSGLFVRGGTSAQTAILMQGVPLFNSAHLLGINSSLDPDAFQTAALAKSGFSAALDGWLSAYLLTEPRATGLKARQLKVGLGVLSSELTYQHYMPASKTGMYAKIKSSYYQLMARLYQELNKEREADNTLPDYSFNDVNLQISRQLPKGSLSLLLFGSQDRYDISQKLMSLNADWGNRLVSVRWKQQLGRKAFLELNQGFSQYAFAIRYQRQERDHTSQTSRGYFTNLSVKLPLHEYVVLEGGAFLNSLRADALSDKHDAEGRQISKEVLREELQTTGVFAQVYLDKDNFSYAAGSRLYRFQQGFLWAPRLKLQWNKTSWARPGLYFDRTFQFHHQVNILGISMPFDFLRFASAELPVQQSDQLGLSLNKSLSRYRISLSLYRRWLNGQLFYPNGTALLRNYKQYFKAHKGQSYGFEAELQAGWHRLKFTAGYTLAMSRLAFENSSGGVEWVYPSQDVRHQLNTSFKYALTRRWQLTGQWFLQTGSPYTFPVGLLPAQGMYPGARYNPVPQFQEFNNIRTPASHRLDVSASYRKQHGKGASEWNFGIYNLYNQANPYFLYFELVPQQGGSAKVVVKQKSLLPITPTIRYTWTLDL